METTAFVIRSSLKIKDTYQVSIVCPEGIKVDFCRIACWRETILSNHQNENSKLQYHTNHSESESARLVPNSLAKSLVKQKVIGQLRK